MTNQYKQEKTRRMSFIKLATVVLAIVAMIGCFSILISAADAPALTLDEHFTIDMQTENGVYAKEYDGTADADITLNAAGVAYLKASLALTPEELALVDFAAEAKFNSANVAEASSITVTLTATANAETDEALAAAQKAAGLLPSPLSMAARITPKVLSWKYTNGNLPLTAQYVLGQSDYSVSLNTASLPAFTTGETPAFAANSLSVVLKNVQLSDVSGSGVAQTVEVALADANYCAEPLNVVVTFKPIELTKITWVDYEKLSRYTFTFGDIEANQICALGTSADGNAYPLSIEYPANYGSAGTYDITAIAPEGFAFASGVAATMRVTINPRTYTVWMDDASFIGNADHQVEPTVYSLTVGGNLPADILAAITYTNNGQSAFGSYEVVATLPQIANYVFLNSAGEEVTSLTATLQIGKSYITAENPDMPYQVILSTPDGILGGVSATVTVPENLSGDVLEDFIGYKAYTVTIIGSTQSPLTLTVPVSSDLYLKDCEPFSAENLYVYNNVTGELTRANAIEGLSVVFENGCYQVTGVEGDSETTFVIAPTYTAPFWGSVWSVLLIIFLVLVLLGGMMALGFFRLRRKN